MLGQADGRGGRGGRCRRGRRSGTPGRSSGRPPPDGTGRRRGTGGRSAGGCDHSGSALLLQPAPGGQRLRPDHQREVEVAAGDRPRPASETSDLGHRSRRSPSRRPGRVGAQPLGQSAGGIVVLPGLAVDDLEAAPSRSSARRGHRHRRPPPGPPPPTSRGARARLRSRRRRDARCGGPTPIRQGARGSPAIGGRRSGRAGPGRAA